MPPTKWSSRTSSNAAQSDATKTVQQKADFLDSIIPWAAVLMKNAQDMLFRLQSGRFLWVKLALATFDERVSAVVGR